MGTGSLAIRVWEEDGHRPVAGATVEMANAGGELPGGATDAGGSFQVHDLPEGRVAARVTAPGFAPSEPQRATVADGLVATLRFALERSVPVEGIVVARDGGAPVAGAHVAAIRGRALMRRGVAFAECTTDSAGRFRFAAIPRTAGMSQAAVLVVSHESHATADVVVRPAPSDDGPIHVRVEMAAGTALRGIVLDGEGRPLAGAEVEAHAGGRSARLLSFGGGPSWRSSAAGGNWIERPRTTDTAPDGTFVLAGLARGEEYTVLAKAKGSAPSEPMVLRAEDGAPPVELRLRASGRLVIRVVDGRGRPRADATVSVSDESHVFEGVPDGPGVWRYDVAAESVSVFVQAPGLMHHYRRVTIREGRTTAARVTMKPAHHVAGVVVDDIGAPLAGARVCANDDPHYSDDALLRNAPFTDADGRFRLEGLPATVHRVIAESAGGERGETGAVRPPADGVRVVVTRGVTVRARLAPPAGEPAPRDVHLAHAARTFRIRRSRTTMERWRQESVRADDGVVEIPGVPAGGVALRLLVSGFQRIERRIDAHPGETVDLGRIALEPALDLTGRVLGADGGPLAGMRVSVAVEPEYHRRDATPWVLSATTAADGTFRLRGLSRGRAKLVVPTTWLMPPTFDVDVGSGEPVTLTIPADHKEMLPPRLFDAARPARSKRRRSRRRR